MRFHGVDRRGLSKNPNDTFFTLVDNVCFYAAVQSCLFQITLDQAMCDQAPRRLQFCQSSSRKCHVSIDYVDSFLYVTFANVIMLFECERFRERQMRRLIQSWNVV